MIIPYFRSSNRNENKSLLTFIMLGESLHPNGPSVARRFRDGEEREKTTGLSETM